MATTVGQHSVAAFTSPVNGTTPIDANTVRGNDNTVRVAYVDHDADPGIHVQSSTLASRPVAGTAGRKWITEDSGVYTLWFDDGTNWHPVSSENVALSVLAGETLAKGDVVKVTGWNNGQDLPEVAKVASASDTAFAVMTAAVASGAMGYATNTGIVQDVNTGSFSVGNILYPNTSGGFTATKPTSGNYQPVAFVLRSNSNNGVIFVEFSAPRIVERSDNTASTIVLRDASGNFSAGTITAGALTSTGLVTFASLKGTGATTVTNILDEDNMASDSATALATQQSIKAYVDAKVATVDTLAEVLANGNTTGANDIVVNSGQKIRTPLVAAQDGTSAITIANSTGALTLNTALADSNLATISTAGKVSNSATTATSANTASAIVARDASGNFTAGTITAALTGNASTATTLQTARTINGVSFNGSADITVTAAAGTLTGNTLASGVTASSLTSVGTLTSLTVSGTTTVSGGGASATPYTTLNGLRLSGGDANNTIWGDTRQISITNSNSFIYLAPTSSGGTQGLAVNTTNGNVTAYNALTVGGNLAVDTNTLYVDAANNRVGVGTASPSAGWALDVYSATEYVGLKVRNASHAYVSIEAGQANLQSILELKSQSKTCSLTLNTDNNLYISNGSNNLVYDTSGNLGLGVTPSAWGSATRALEVSTTSFRPSLSYVAGEAYLTHNAYYDGSNWKFTGSGYGATRFQCGVQGQFTWATTGNVAGTAGNNITFTQAMTLDASGILMLGRTTAPSTAGAKIAIAGSGDTSYQVTKDGVVAGRITAVSTAMAFGVDTTDGATERARIDSSGNLGVGTASPATMMELSRNSGLGTGTGTTVALRISDTSQDGGAGTFNTTQQFTALQFYSADGSGVGASVRASVGATMETNIGSASALTFFTHGSERARITSGGYFKASDAGTYEGSTTGYHELRSSTNDQPAAFVSSTAANGNQYGMVIKTSNDQNSTQYFLSCNGSTTQRAIIYTNGGLANYSANDVNLASDERLKKDIAPLASTWDKLKGIEVVNFRYKDCNEDDPALYGVIAQQVQPIVPELVVVTREAVEAKDAVLDEDGNEVTPAVEAAPEYYGIREQPMYWLAIKALQEAQARIEALEVEVAALKAGA